MVGSECQLFRVSRNGNNGMSGIMGRYANDVLGSPQPLMGVQWSDIQAEDTSMLQWLWRGTTTMTGAHMTGYMTGDRR